MRNFRNLEIWRSSIQLVSEIYKLTNNFPEYEKYGLVSQIRRCAVSIPSNIAEGCSRDTSKEFSRFIQIAIGSSFELETQLLIAKKLAFTSNQHQIIADLNVIQKRLNALNTSIKRNS